MAIQVSEYQWARTEHRTCPICNDQKCDKIYRVPADGIIAECDVVICSSCGFTFSDTPTTQAEFDRYYAGCKKYGPETTGPSSWNAGRYAETARRFRDLGIDGPILDVGGGARGLATIAARYGFRNIHGTDTPLASIKCTGHKATCVTLCHVLEHVRDLNPAIRNLAGIAETVYAEVPDAARYHEFCESPYQQFNSEHVNHFTAEHLRRLFERHGFAQVASGRGECGDPPPHLSPYIWGFFERAKSPADTVRAYLDRSGVQWQKIEARLKALPRDKMYVCWGLGQLYKKLSKAGLLPPVAWVVDRTAKDGETLGVVNPVRLLTPDEHAKWANDLPILVTTIQHRESVLADISRMGIRNEVVTLP